MLVLGRKVSQRTIITHRSGEKIEILVTRVQADQGGGFKINIGFEEPDGRRNFDVQRPERASRREASRNDLSTQEVETLRRLATDPNPTEGVLDWIPTRLPRPTEHGRDDLDDNDMEILRRAAKEPTPKIVERLKAQRNTTNMRDIVARLPEQEQAAIAKRTAELRREA